MSVATWNRLAARASRSQRSRRAAQLEAYRREQLDKNPGRDRKVALKRKGRVVRDGPEPVREKLVAVRARPDGADLRIAELREQLEANRLRRKMNEHIPMAQDDESDELELEAAGLPPNAKRVRVAEPLRLPTREQIAALCLDAYRIALDSVRYEKGRKVPAPQVAAACAALRCLTEVCGYGQMKRNDIVSDQERESALAAVDADTALERLRSKTAVAQQPKPRF